MMVSCYQIHRPIGVCMVGGLQYFTLTRPEISFAVGVISQYMQSPRVPHLVAAKRILRYLKAVLFWKPCHYCLLRCRLGWENSVSTSIIEDRLVGRISGLVMVVVVR